MTFDSRDTQDMFWTLSMLMTDFSIEVTPREVRRFAPLISILPAGTRVGLTARPTFPTARSHAAASALVWSGMRPVLPLHLSHVADRGQVDRTLARWEHLGVDDIVLEVGVAHDLGTVLDDIVDLLSGPDFRRRRFRSIGVRLDGFRNYGAGTPVPESADLLRALDAARGFAHDLGIELYLTTPPTARTHPLVRWERSLRAAGNRLPIRVGLPGPWCTDPLPWWRPVSSRQDPHRLVLDLAAAVAQDPDSKAQSVQLFPARSFARTARWALDLGNGNFVIEHDPDGGHRVAILS